MTKLNTFFDEIYVINLFDMIERWDKVYKQFKKRGIRVNRFAAIDGRCKAQGDEGCEAKAKSFEISYNVVINAKLAKRKGWKLIELLPASSLTIGTVLLLRHMVKHKMKRILICEDDIVLSRNFEKNFAKGIKELEKSKYAKSWDLLYLGCGNLCGDKGISEEKTSKTKHISQLSQFVGDDWYVNNKDDLRMTCDECKNVSEHLSIADEPGGTWCYAYSLKGAKKLLKLIDNKVYNHIDKIIAKEVVNSNVRALAFNPPIVMHEYGAIRSDSQIPWEW